MNAAFSGVALVTGGGRGVGRAIAERLARDGARVAVVARSAPEVEASARAIGGLALTFDVTDEAATRDAVARVEEALGPIDLLVANAGVDSARHARAWEHSAAEWWRVVEVNLLGTYLSAQAVLPGMVDRGTGRIVAVASNAAFAPLASGSFPPISAYAASKAGVVRLVEAIAAEAAPEGVKAFAVSPGLVRTRMTLGVFDDVPEDAWSPPELISGLVAHIAAGALDGLSGRYVHARTDDWASLDARAQEIREHDLLSLRLRSLDSG